MGQLRRHEAQRRMNAGVTEGTGITAIVTAFDRIDQTLETLRRIAACDPPPARIMVHVDDNRSACAAAVQAFQPCTQVILSPTRVGPGGGRNRMMAAADSELVASFDDDSYPIDADYFERVRDVFQRFPDASIVTARVIHAHQPVREAAATAEWIADFSGGACTYRREHYLDAGGY